MRRKVFVNREFELETLERLWAKKNFSLVIIYGRRRIGKTRLLTEFSKGKKCVFYVAVESSYELISKEFSETVKKFIGLSLGGDILDVIENLTTLIDEKILIVLDEFQYIVNADPSFISRLQRLIDLKLKDRKLMLILCGSAVSFFENKLLGYRSPIFGRCTSSMKIKALNLFQIKDFFPSYDLKTLISVYSIVGGTPGYLEKLDPEKSLEWNIRMMITPGSYLFDEAINLLKQEMREPRTYFSILAAIADGKTSLGEISSIAKIDPRSITKYITLLEDLSIVKRVRPIGFKRPVRVCIEDNYFRFWFSYIYKLRSLLEARLIDEALSYILDTFDRYISYVFEDIVIEIVPLLFKEGLIQTRPIQVGKWWHKDTEIDVIVREPGVSTTFMEVKWSELNVRRAENILMKLIEKSKESGLTSPMNYYILVCKSLLDSDTPLKAGKHKTIIDLKYLNSIFHKHP